MKQKRDYFEEKEQNELMSNKHKKVSTTLVGIPIGITSFP